MINVTLNHDSIPQAWRNESVYAHVYFVRNHADPLVHGKTENVHRGVINLIHHTKRPKAKKTKNLISGDMSARDKVRDTTLIVVGLIPP